MLHKSDERISNAIVTFSNSSQYLQGKINVLYESLWSVTDELRKNKTYGRKKEGDNLQNVSI